MRPAPLVPQLSNVRDLPRRALAAGGGHVREICGSWGARNQLEWVFQIVELRGANGLLTLPPDSAHSIAGIGGPQVEVGPGLSTGLRKERVLAYSGSHIEFRRPRLRAAELSRIAVLSVAGTGATPSLVFADLHGSVTLEEGRVRAVVVRSGRVRVGGETAGALDALVLPTATELVAEAEDARVLLLVG
ncbi:hypothetical protein [Microbacterium panaciterrae]|uniref:HutD family protein n=1 Tax=Microbacterium panaciterrae TaxID=985759 RepID=A0ABP8P9U8_9MICO